MWKYIVFLLVACSALSGCEEAGEAGEADEIKPVTDKSFLCDCHCKVPDVSTVQFVTDGNGGSECIYDPNPREYCNELCVDICSSDEILGDEAAEYSFGQYLTISEDVCHKESEPQARACWCECKKDANTIVLESSCEIISSCKEYCGDRCENVDAEFDSYANTPCENT